MENISFKVDPIDKQRIYQLAEALGFDSVSHFIREAIDQMIIRHYLNQQLPRVKRKRGPDSRIFKK